ncbi:hypothetical protein [Nocardia tengchongensis]|uniref:hypothetical protein n=1 Tax=Nocardia tengchongensis TaxID=2055889 RepID=UPI00369D10FF
MTRVMTSLTTGVIILVIRPVLTLYLTLVITGQLRELGFPSRPRHLRPQAPGF